MSKLGKKLIAAMKEMSPNAGIGTTPFDAADYLDTEEARAEFLREASDTDDAEYIERANATVARSREKL